MIFNHQICLVGMNEGEACGLKSMKCRLDKITVHYEIHGEGRPIIMLHGGGPDRRSMIGSMEPILRNLSGWQRVYPDLPGFGETLAEDWISSSDDMLKVVLDFIDAIMPEQRLVLVGESYGAYLARGIIHRRPKLVDGLLMICPPVVMENEKRSLPKPVTLVRKFRPPSERYPVEAKMFDSFAVVITRRAWERTLKEIFSGLLAADKALSGRLEANMHFSFNVDASPTVFDKPALIIAGRQDSMVGYRDPWTMIEKFPRATFAVLDRAGHNLHIEQEHLFNTLVKEWLNRVQENMQLSQ